MHEKLHCANRRCTHNNIAAELCTAKNMYYDCENGMCMTFSPCEMEAKPKELMQTFNPGCHKTQSGYKANRTGMVLK